MISVQNLTKYFGPVMAIDRVNFEVDRGEIVGFLGPNGAGKTTTMRILTSYLPATNGTAKVAGFDVMTESMDVRRNIGYLPESVPIYSEMRVEEYLDFAPSSRAWTAKSGPNGSNTASTAAEFAKFAAGLQGRYRRATANA